MLIEKILTLPSYQSLIYNLNLYLYNGAETLYRFTSDTEVWLVNIINKCLDLMLLVSNNTDGFAVSQGSRKKKIFF